MKRDLAQAGKWLTGAAVAAVLAYVGIVASSDHAMLWPFWLFAGIGVPSLAAYLRWRNLPLPAVEPPSASPVVPSTVGTEAVVRSAPTSRGVATSQTSADHTSAPGEAALGGALQRSTETDSNNVRPARMPEDPQYKYDVFISHAHGDRDVIARVTECLRRADISYWIDEEQIQFGDQIVSKIEDGLRDSHFVLAALSRALVRSGWCRAEYGPILHQEFSGNTSRRVIPFSLDGTADENSIPLLLWDKMRVDFTNEQSFAEFINFLKDDRK